MAERNNNAAELIAPPEGRIGCPRMARPPQIVAFGGGGFSMEKGNRLLDDYVLEQTAVRRPREA